MFHHITWFKSWMERISLVEHLCVERLLLLTAGMEGCVTPGELVGMSFLMGGATCSFISGVTWIACL